MCSENLYWGGLGVWKRTARSIRNFSLEVSPDLVTGTVQIFGCYDFHHFWKVTSSLNTSNLVFGFPQKLGAPSPAAFGDNDFLGITPTKLGFGEMQKTCIFVEIDTFKCFVLCLHLFFKYPFPPSPPRSGPDLVPTFSGAVF